MKVIGHRGAAGLFFENTEESVRRGLNAGVDGIEIDVQVTLEGELIVFHDNYYDRLTTFQGVIKDSPTPKAFRLKNGNRVPTLLEILSIVDGNATLFIEVKNDLDFEVVYQNLIKKLHHTQFVMISFFHQGLYDLKIKFPDVIIGMLFEGALIDFDSYLRKVNADYVITSIDTFNEDMANEIHYQKRKLIFYGVREKVEVALALKANSYGIVTDNPIQIQAFLQELRNE